MLPQTVFLELMNRFLHPQHPLPDLDGLSPEELNRLLQLGMAHSVYPVVFDAVRTCAAFRALPDQVRQTETAGCRRLVLGQAVRTSQFTGVYQHLLRGGVTPLVVKGLVLRSLYDQPDYRASSDEDLLVRKEEFFRLDELLTELGFTRELGDHPLEEHEIPYWNAQRGLHLEIHLTLFPEDSGAYGYLNGAFRDVFGRQVTEQIQGVGIHTLDWTDHMLYLICHSLKHFLHGGFGIRQVCDMVKFAECRGSRIDWDRLEDRTRELGIYIFWQNLADIGERYLGLDRSRAGLERPRDLEPDSDAMLADLLDSGIYGKRTEERVHSSNVTLQAAAGSRSGGGLGRAMFPELSYMKIRYPYLQRHRWLLPVAWGQRLIGYVRRSGSREIASTVDLGRHRVELLRQYGLVQDRQ